MIGVLTVFHVIISVSLIVVVLLQSGRGTGLASVFGGGGGGSLVGGRGFGGILAKATAVLAISFMLTSIALTVVPRGGGEKSIYLERQSGEPTGMPMEQGPAEGTQPTEVPAGESGQ